MTRTTLGAMALTIGGLLAGTSAATAQPDGALPEPDAGTGAARFAVAALEPGDERITLITPERDCGYTAADRVWSTVHVHETPTDVLVRLDMRRMPSGAACSGDHQVRVPVLLEEPIGERTVRNGGLPGMPTAIINTVAPIDTGLRYSCGLGSFRVVDMLGPGLEVDSDKPQPSIPDARAVVATEDQVVYLGQFNERGKAPMQSFWFDGQAWRGGGSDRCRPMVALLPGRFAASWSLRFPRPEPGDRRIRINVRGRPCHGSPPPPDQIVRPILHIRKDSIVITTGTFFPNQLPYELYETGAAGGYAFIDCNGFGPSPYVVRLPHRLGDRKLYDGSVFPPRERGASPD